MLHREVAALEVHGEQPVPILLRQLHHAADMGDADVVVQHVDAAVGIGAGRHHAADVVMAGHVGADRLRRAAFRGDQGGGFVRGIFVRVGTQQLRPLAGEQYCRRLAVAPAWPNRPGAHHQRDLVPQPPGHVFLPRDTVTRKVTLPFLL